MQNNQMNSNKTLAERKNECSEGSSWSKVQPNKCNALQNISTRFNQICVATQINVVQCKAIKWNSMRGNMRRMNAAKGSSWLNEQSQKCNVYCKMAEGAQSSVHTKKSMQNNPIKCAIREMQCTSKWLEMLRSSSAMQIHSMQCKSDFQSEI